MPQTTTTTEKKVVPNPHIQKDLAPEIIKEAEKWLHVREIGNNAGFTDKIFESGMKSVGWVKGQPWCAYFTKFVYLQVYQRYEPGLVEELKKMLTGHVMTNVRNSKKNLLFPLSQKTPVPGGIMCFAVGENGSGHTGIYVRSVGTLHHQLIEGNTNGSGSRDGNGIFIKNRKLNAGSFAFRGIITPRKVMVHENSQQDIF